MASETTIPKITTRSLHFKKLEDEIVASTSFITARLLDEL